MSRNRPDVVSLASRRPRRARDRKPYVALPTAISYRPLWVNIVFVNELEGLTPEELAVVVGGTGRARAVWSAFVRGDDPFEDTELSEALRTNLREHTRRAGLAVERRDVASCGTTKVGYRLDDGKRIETVLIPSERRTTVCVSTQAGCARGCIFCVTATMGLERGLTPGEIVGQVTGAIHEARERGLPPVRNVVYMGMGEPLDNHEPVAKSIAVLCSPRALGLGPAHITLSTVGTTPKAILATRDLPVQIAWSLHAVDDALRRKLVPTARHTTAELRQAFIERGSSLFVEVTLMAGVNDELHHAEAMAEFLAKFAEPVRVNLLPMNAGREGLAPSSPARAVAFRQRLRERGYFCAIRKPRGLDASAACGQLVAS